MMKTTEVAEMLGVSTQTVKKWASNKKIPAYKLSANSWRFEPKEVEEWLNKKKA